MTRSFTLLAAMICALVTAEANARELKVISAGAVRGLIASMIEDYSRKTGQTFDFTVGTTGQLRVVIESDWPTDLIIVSGPLMAEIEKTNKLVPASRTDLGRVGIGVTVKEGAAAPDVSTPEAFKAALVAARSVAYTNPTAGGTSGLYLMGVLDRLGIADAVKKKSVLTGGGKETAEAVVSGEAEIGVTFISEIVAVKGAKLVAPLPAPLQDYTVYTTAIPKTSTEPGSARAFIGHLTSEAMAVRWKAAGFEPPK
jgi:molybdate transport system substrate-binding protein